MDFGNDDFEDDFNKDADVRLNDTLIILAYYILCFILYKLYYRA